MEKRFLLSTRRQRDDMIDFSLNFETIFRTVHGKIASTRQLEPPRREKHFCSAKVQLNVNNRATNDVATAPGIFGR